MNLSLIMLLSACIPNHVVKFIIITELLKWIYQIVYEIFFGGIPKVKILDSPLFASRMKPSPQIRSSSRTKRTAAGNLVGTWQVLCVMDGPDVDE